MVKNILAFSLLLLSPYPSYPQAKDTGFFLVIENKTNCTHLVHALMDVTNTYCLPDDPVITKTEFDFIPELKTNKRTDRQYIDLQLTEKGFETLRTLVARLPNTRLALVVEDNVVGIFQGISSLDTPTVPIYGRPGSAEMNWLYDKVKNGIH